MFTNHKRVNIQKIYYILFKNNVAEAIHLTKKSQDEAAYDSLTFAITQIHLIFYVIYMCVLCMRLLCIFSFSFIFSNVFFLMPKPISLNTYLKVD